MTFYLHCISNSRILIVPLLTWLIWNPVSVHWKLSFIVLPLFTKPKATARPTVQQGKTAPRKLAKVVQSWAEKNVLQEVFAFIIKPFRPFQPFPCISNLADLIQSIWTLFDLVSSIGKCSGIYLENDVDPKGQSYKQFTLVNYESRVVIWGIFKSGTTLES